MVNIVWKRILSLTYITLNIRDYTALSPSQKYLRVSCYLLGSGFEIFKTTLEEDVVLLLGIVVLVSLAPVVADSVGEDLTILVEGALGDGQLARLAVLQLGPGVLVPE